MKGGSSKLCPVSFGIALGITNGLWMMFFAWSVYWWGHGAAILAQLSEVYKGYGPSIAGGFVGLGWGFLEGFFFGLILVLIYDLCLCCKCCCKGSCKKEEDVDKKL